MKINELVEENKTGSKRKTKNTDLYFKLLCAVCSDDEYLAKNVKAIKGDEIITDDLKLSTAFTRLLASVLKKSTTMTDAEANDAAKSFELTEDQAKTLSDIVHEADYIMMKDCGKKVQMFNKPGFDVTLSIGTAPETVRPNPQDRTKSIKIMSHDRLQITQKIFDFQKKTVLTKK